MHELVVNFRGDPIDVLNALAGSCELRQVSLDGFAQDIDNLPQHPDEELAARTHPHADSEVAPASLVEDPTEAPDEAEAVDEVEVDDAQEVVDEGGADSEADEGAEESAEEEEQAA